MRRPSFHHLTTSLPVVAATFLATAPVLAHPGHDHSAPESGLVHLIYAVVVVACVALAGWAVASIIRERRQRPSDD
jgi:multisubunit Na+/H+ antiporter MnhE subunit